METFIGHALEVSFNRYNGKGRIKRHPILPARKFSHSGRDVDITENVLQEMASGMQHKRIPVLLPDNGRENGHAIPNSAPAIGWTVPGTAEVSAFKDGRALYVDVEWQEVGYSAIESKEYAYWSPVFSLARPNEVGIPKPEMIALGLTNDPHWRSDQPELWAEFAASAIKSTDAAMDAANEKENNMDKLEQANARISELEASVTAMTAERDALKKELEEGQAKVAKFSADSQKSDEVLVKLSAQVEELSASNRDLRRKSWLQEFPQIREDRHLKDADGKPTALSAAIDNGDRKSFEFMANLIPARENDNSKPQGGGDGSGVSAREAAHKKAKELMATDKTLSFSAAYMQAYESLEAEVN